MRFAKAVILTGVTAYFATLAVFGQTEKASAAQRRTSASICHSIYDDAGISVARSSDIWVSDQQWSVFCPVISDTFIPHGRTKHLTIYGENRADSTPGSYSRACVHDTATRSTSCGVETPWSVTSGKVAPEVSTSEWRAHPRWFPYVYNLMSPNTTLFGFTTAT